MLNRSFVRVFSDTVPLKRTALYQLHCTLKGKLVPFAGWEMPVQYPDGVLKSHFHTRESCSLFDVSHMGQLKITGKDRVSFIESVSVADVQALAVNQARLSSFTNDQFGVIDDCMVTKRENHLCLNLAF